MRVDPVTLEDRSVRLEPLRMAHAEDLLAVMDAETFRFMPSGPRAIDPDGVRGYIDDLLARPNHLAFAVIDRAARRAVGSTSYMNIRPEHRGLEIGCTWIAPAARGTGLNRAMKRLMLSHAFGPLDALRVELRTDAINARSRRAIEKLGAPFEGVLRSHMMMPDGRLRDTAVYAITHADWPAVRRQFAE
jgi:RimJ/RimL family protein N-acetyltransferase